MISDFDEEICIFHCPESLGDELWGCRVAMAQLFLRGWGVFRLSKIKNAQTRHNIDMTTSFLLSDRIVQNLHNLGLFTT